MRWLATRIHGNGTETVVADELPVSGGTVQRALSGTGGAAGTIPVEVARLQGTRAAAEAAMLAVSGKTRIAYGTVEPPPDADVLWLRGPERVPYGYQLDPPGWQPIGDPQLAAAAQIENERVLVPGITGLYCLTNHGVVLGGGILTEDSGREGPAYALDGHGHAGYPENMPYDGNRQWVQVDPAMLIRHAWDHVQTRPRHDLGVAVDNTTTPVRVGHPEEEVSFETGSGEQVDFTVGPVKWNYWSTHDLAKEIDDLAAEAPIEYTMTHTWDRQANVPSHRLRLGYPRLGRRRHDITFTVGVNVVAEPQVTTALDVSRVLVVGAGEGSEARRGWATRSTQALGRTVVLTDKTLTSNSACVAAAQRHLDWLVGEDEVTTLTVRDHPNAPLATWNMGDDIRIQGSSTGWGGDLDMWVRVLSDDIDPEAGEATLTVTRAERTG